MARAGLAHIEAVAEDSLVAVNRPGHDHQALSEVADRCCVAVAEVLLDLVDGPLDAAAVRRVVTKVARENVRVAPARVMLRDAVHGLCSTAPDRRGSRWRE